MRPVLGSLALTCLAACSAGAFAGGVAVTYVNPSTFADAGNSTWDEKENLDRLARYLESLGRDLLPANQTLRIEVLDVHLAGTLREPSRNGVRLRTMRGNADWPRVSLRYTLEADGKPLRSGEELVSDVNYLQGSLPPSREIEPLYYEKRMLARWFRERFNENAPLQYR